MKSSSESSSSSSVWAIANKGIAIIVATFAAVPPAAMIYGGIMHHVQAEPPGTSSAQVVVESAGSSPAPAPATISTTSTTAPVPNPSATAAASAINTAAGQQVYMTVCVACHQPNGMGLPNMFPPLAGTDWVNGPKPDRIIRNVLHGVTGPITINGKPFTTPAPLMPPQGAALDDQKIADVLTFVRTSWGNTGGPVTADQVKVVREVEKARTAMWTEAELLKIPDR